MKDTDINERLHYLDVRCVCVCVCVCVVCVPTHPFEEQQWLFYTLLVILYKQIYAQSQQQKP